MLQTLRGKVKECVPTQMHVSRKVTLHLLAAVLGALSNFSAAASRARSSCSVGGYKHQNTEAAQ